MEYLKDFLNNDYFFIGFIGWFSAQFIKVITTLIKDKKFVFSRFVGSGGMPSSHSSFVMAITTSIGMEYGLESAIFAVALAFSLVVMYDAAGVRRAVGKQAIVVNRIIKDLQDNRKKKKKEKVSLKKGKEIFTEERLKELIGHTPIEVFLGAALGISIGVFLS